MFRFRLLVAGMFAAFYVPTTARAAESYEGCTGFIDALPAVISTQGVWCLRKNLSTSVTSGAAITIAAHNVSVDCNNFKIGGLAAGADSWAFGIQAEDRLNLVIQHCNVRGFYIGISLEDTGGGHLVEDNRLDQNLYGGIYVSGENNRVLRNQVYDTGGRLGGTTSFGISAAADIIDNTVSGVYTDGPTSFVLGIEVNVGAYEARNNYVRGMVPGAGTAAAMQANAFGASFTGNRVSSVSAGTAGTGIWANGGFCIDNVVLNYQTPYGACSQEAGNLSSPN
jgi:parallel beta-helix repeat protein